MPGQTLTPSCRVRCLENMGWLTPDGFQEIQRGIILVPHQYSPLRRLATNSRMQQLQTRRQAPLLWMRSGLSWSSKLSSITESIRPLRHTFRMPWSLSSQHLASYISISMSSQAFVMVSLSIFQSLLPHKPLPIVNPSLNLRKNSVELWSAKYINNGTSDQLADPTLKFLLDLFNHPRFPSSRNQGNQTNTVTYRIIPFQLGLPLAFLTLPSTRALIRTFSLQPGEPFLSSPFFCVVYLLTPNWLRETLQKLIVQYPFTTRNGRPQLYGWQKMRLPSTLLYASDLHLRQGHMATSGMQQSMFLDTKALAQFLAGLMIIFSSASDVFSLQNTTGVANHGTKRFLQETNTMMVVGYGSAERSSKMGRSTSSMRTALSHVRTCRSGLIELQKMPSILTTSMTSISSPNSSASLGNYQKIYLLPHQRLTLGLNGTLKLIRCPWVKQRKRSIFEQQWNGRQKPPIPFKRFKNSMVNSSMHASSFPWDAHISPSWNPCSAYSTIILSCHTPDPKVSEQILSGGLTLSDSPSSADQFRNLSRYMMSGLSQMPAPELALPSPLGNSGELGDSSLDGKLWMVNGTSAGQRQLRSSVSFALSSTTPKATETSSHTETTKELSKVGGMAGVETEQSIMSSSAYTLLSQVTQLGPQFTRHMSIVAPTQQMVHRAAFTPRPPYYFHPYNSLQSLTNSSLTRSRPTPQLNNVFAEKADILEPLPKALTMLTRGIMRAYDTALMTSSSRSMVLVTNPAPKSNKFDIPLPDIQKPPSVMPRSYRSSLMPLPSSLRPHCLARDRLRLWCPLKSRSDDNGDIHISESDLARILEVINVSWAKGTRDVYGAGLLVFHVFCDVRNVPEEQRGPASPLLIIAFISCCAGSYAGSTLANYVFAIRAWHILHGMTWRMDNEQVKAALAGAANLAPPTSKRPKRAPITVELMGHIFEKLDPSDPLDAAVRGCFSSIFYSVSRSGEFTLPSLNSFDPTIHVKPSDISHRVDRNQLDVTVFRLPKTKCSEVGEDVFWSPQTGITDPKVNLENHLRINNPPINGPLFAYRHSKGLRPLTKRAFLDRINMIASSIGEDNLKGHGIRIGATLEYLLRGIPFDVVKSLGRWGSEAFVLYLRQHAIIIAPYIQNQPILEAFTRYTMPPVRQR